MKINRKNSEEYSWGDNCSGWHLVKSNQLSIIEELMPPKTKEEKHYHNFSQQFFYILNGIAFFEIEGEEIEVEKGNGIYILPQQKHRIRNDTSENLEFIVISQPTTREDRFNEPFNEAPKISLNGKMFKSIKESSNGEVNSETVFHYRQNNEIVWATYEGGSIVFGTLSGRKEENRIIFSYQHQNTEGEFMTGKCVSTIETINGKIRLEENWEWTCKDYSSGKSILEEIDITTNII